MIEAFSVKSTDFINKEGVYALTAKCVNAAEKWAQFAERI